MAVPQDQAVTNANAVVSALQQLSALYSTIVQTITTYQHGSVGGILAALPTRMLNADGTLGAPDPSPVAGNPIDNAVISRLTLAISSYNIGAMISLLIAVQTLLDGGTVTAQPAAPDLLAKATPVH